MLIFFTMLFVLFCKSWNIGKPLAMVAQTTSKGSTTPRSAPCLIWGAASKVMLKILQARLQQYGNRELPDVQAGFRKGRRTRDQIANIRWIMEKAREFQKNVYFCFIDCAKAFDCVDHNKLWKILKEMGIPDHLTCLWEICMQVRKQQLELDMEQQTGSK